MARSSIHRLSLWLTGMTVMVSVSSPAMADPACTLPEIVARYENWRGGDAFRAVKTLHINADVEASGLKGTSEEWSDNGGRIRTDIDLHVYKQQLALTPNSGWETTLAGQVQSLALVNRLSLERNHRLLMPDGLRDGGAEAVKLAGCASENGRTKASLLVSFGDADSYTVSIDAENGELLGVRETENRQETLISFAEWRVVDGVRFAFVTTSQKLAEHDTQISKVTALAVNGALAEAVFDRPQGVHLTRFANGATSTGWIDFDFLNNKLIVFSAKINGQPVRVLLDSGAEVSVADKSFAKSIQLGGEGALPLQGVGGVESVSMASNVSVDIGNLTLSGLSVPLYDLSPVTKASGRDISFVLGDEVFNELVVDIDFARHRIAFRDPATVTTPHGAIAVPLRRIGGLRSVPVTVENGPDADFHFDLGNSSAGVLIYPAHVQASALLQNRKSSELVSVGVGGYQPQKVATLGSVAFAGQTFKQVPATLLSDTASVPNHVAGNIGIPILSRFRLLIDYPHDRLSALIEPGQAGRAFSHDRLGVRLEEKDGLLMVKFVSPHSPAEAAGLKAGDRISAINGKPAKEWNFAALNTLSYASNSAVVEMRLADGSVLKIAPAKFY